MFKELFGFSLPGFETPEEIQKLANDEYYERVRKARDNIEKLEEDKE